MRQPADQDIDSGLIRIYILYRAAIEPISSLEIVEMLERHGFRFSVGSVSQILRVLEKKGYLVSTGEPKTYRLTGRGRLVITQARKKVRQLLRDGKTAGYH